ncbi:MAG TPA: molybdopterin-guanine dinucleotide biosynthesis protein B [Dongiaceae bacterium]|jgi:molybdopterin-guanine dinucleotide biosynthesis protein MobB|nr:molybdopterin-guanine dinucleotide biosynthesis protein B [Dongiaceae bacterium]
MKILGLAGWSNSGKTHLLTRLLPAMKRRGLAISTIKHAHHSFDIDQPGKDSHAHRQAGAREVLISSRKRWALMHELEESESEPSANELVRKLAPVDLVLIEGFKRERHPKIEVHNPSLGLPLLAGSDPTILAVISPVPVAAPVPCFHPDDFDALVDFLCQRLDLPWHS